MDNANAYSTTALQGMEMLRREESICDVTFEVEGRHFPCHKLVLSSVSAFFKTMFTTPLRNPDEKVIKLDFLNAENFNLLLDYLYSGKDILNEENGCTMLEIANYTQIDILQDMCIRYLIQGLNMENCIIVWHLGKKLCLQNLIDESVSYVTKNFDQVVLNESLFEATTDDIEIILSSPESALPTEDNITEFLLRWLKYNLEQNLGEAKTRVYRFLRLPLCSGEYLVSLKQNHKSFFEDQEFGKIFDKAVEYHLQPARVPYLLSKETEQRPASKYENVLLVFTREAELFAFSFFSECWFRLNGPPNSPGTNFGMCLFNSSTIYVSGGASTRSTLSKYNGNHNLWTTVSMPFCIYRHTMTTVNHYLYILGGTTKKDALSHDIKNVDSGSCAVRRYNPAQDNWCVVGEIPNALHDASSAVINNKIYLVGGLYLKSNRTVENRSVYAYDIMTNMCSEIDLYGYHFVSSIIAYPCHTYFFILDFSGRNGKLHLNSQTFERGQTIEPKGGIDMAHLFKNRLIVFGKKMVDENDKEEKDEYEVTVVKVQEGDIDDCTKMTIATPSFKRSKGIARCANILINRTHLQMTKVPGIFQEITTHFLSANSS